jgi:hypothetical protein
VLKWGLRADRFRLTLELSLSKLSPYHDERNSMLGQHRVERLEDLGVFNPR